MFFETAHHMIYTTLHCDVNFCHLVAHYGDNNTAYGALVDLDLASVSETTGQSHHGRRTGTRRFMARELLVKEPPLHLERFDWESFFYVLCWIGTHYSEGTEIETNALHTWNTDDDDTLNQCKSTAVDGNITPTLKGLFTVFYKPIYGSWITPMQRMFLAADTTRLKFTDQMSEGNTLSFDEETIDGLITWEKIWNIIKN